MKKIKNIPNISAIKNSICFEIEDRKDHFTHSFFKYPAKFPSEVANWSIRNFSKKNDLILDCFAGSGTSIVEALMLGRRPLAIDSDPLSKIIIKQYDKIDRK
jgi:DNA modification methylase